VWEWYGWRRGLVAQCTPNAAHRALAAWTARAPGVVLVTQNVDDLHERAAREAGAPDGPPRVLKVHGAIFRARCTACGTEDAHDGPVDVTSEATLPRCACGGLLRPAVVWFGEALPRAALQAAVDAARDSQAFLSIGTSGVVQPAASLAYAAKNQGAALIEINPEATALTDQVDFGFCGKAGEVLPALLAALINDNRSVKT
jgi:NAD-dependent deacetylase